MLDRPTDPDRDVATFYRERLLEPALRHHPPDHDAVLSMDTPNGRAVRSAAWFALHAAEHAADQACDRAMQPLLAAAIRAKRAHGKLINAEEPDELDAAISEGEAAAEALREAAEAALRRWGL